MMSPRRNWQEKCDKVGFTYHSIDNIPYWYEGAAYKFTLDEINNIEAVTNELHDMCLTLVSDVVKSGDYSEFNLSPKACSLVEQSWREKEPHLYGRFDFGYDGEILKMLEYNADTPTSLLEASVVQWEYITDMGLPDQFNSIHEKLIERWKFVMDRLPITGRQLYFMSVDTWEDWGCCQYLMDTALQAGFEKVSWIETNEIELRDDNCFYDTNGNRINSMFKLYPWEWMVNEAGGENFTLDKCRMVEPAWKMLLSNKHLLHALWSRNIGHPNLLKSQKTPEGINMFVKKPALSREGSNVTVIDSGKEVEVSGKIPEYEKDFIYQQYFELLEYKDPNVNTGVVYPIIGSWVIGDESAGMGVRDGMTRITNNTSLFVPHYFVEN